MKAHTFILLALSCSSSRGEIDLNVKSDTLKHILSPPPQDSTTSSTSTKVSASQHNFISLDLAGEIQTHVSSPYENDEQSVNAKPLFYWGALGKKKIPIPNVHIGAQYDFRRHWFGVTRFISTLSWGQSKDDTFSMKIRGEMGHDLTEDYSVQWNLETNYRKGRSLKPKLMARFDTKHGSRGTTVAASASIHPRLNIVAKVIAVAQGSSSNYDELRYQQALIHRVPQEKLNWSEGTWLPDVKMTTGGKIIASSAIGLPRGKSNGNDVAVRLMARRQMDWNIVGFLNGSSEDYVRDDENQTILRLEVGSKGNDSLSYWSISAEAALENIRNSWKCTVQQERLIQL
jgi:hypothetical protein